MSKKIISILISVMMVLSLALPAYAFDRNPDYSLGDVDGNGKISAADARKILRHAAQVDNLSDAQLWAADIDGNNKISASDARIALRISATLDSIDKYIKEDETDKDTDADTDTSTELSGYLGGNVAAMEKALGVKFSNADSNYTSDVCNVVAEGSSGANIKTITLFTANGYSLCGVKIGDNLDSVRKSIAAKNMLYNVDINETEGYVRTVNAYDYTCAKYLDIFFDYETGTVRKISCYTDKYDIGRFIGYQFEDVYNIFPGLEYNSADSAALGNDVYSNKYISVNLNQDGAVVDVFVYGECVVPVYSVCYGDTREKVEEKFSSNGIEFIDENTGYRESDGVYISLDFADNGTVCYINVYLQSEDGGYEYVDLSYVLFWNVYDIADTYNIGICEGEFGVYYAEDMTISFVTSDGRVHQIVLEGYSDFGIRGIQIGMHRDEVISIFEAMGFEDSQNGTFIEELSGNTILVEYDNEDCAKSIAYSNLNNSIDLSTFLNSTIDDVFMKLGSDFEFDGDNIYSNDEILIRVVESEECQYVDGVEIDAGDNYNILGVSIGMDAGNALDMLQNLGLEGRYVADDEIRAWDYSSEFVFIAFVDEYNQITYLGCMFTENDVENILGENIEDVIYTYPDIIYDEMLDVYTNEHIRCYLNESGIVNSVYVSDSAFTVFDTCCGMPLSDAIEIVAKYGFEATDENIVCNETENIVIVYDYEEGVICGIDVYAGGADDDTDTETIELVYYLGESAEAVASELGLFIDEEGDYVADGYQIRPDFSGKIKEVNISDECDATIYFITYGTSAADAIANLEINGLTVSDYGTMIYAEDATNGIFVMVTLIDGYVNIIAASYL